MEDLRQVAPLDEQETHISIDYKLKTLFIFTSRATVMKRLLRKGYKPVKTTLFEGEVESMEFEFSTGFIGKFLRTGIFGYSLTESFPEAIEEIEDLDEEEYT